MSFLNRCTFAFPFACFFYISGAIAQDVLPTARPLSGTTEDRIYVDFRNKGILVYGLYSAQAQGKRNGVDGEIFARREGKQILTDHLDALCKNSRLDDSWTSRLKVKKDWNPNSLTSQGSEIFPGSNLLIRLTAPLEKIFQKFPANKVNVIQNSEGETFVFKVPALPLSVLRCGTAKFKDPQGRVGLIAPGYAASSPAGTTVIQLGVLKDTLAAATPADSAALKRSGFSVSESETSPTIVPVESTGGN